MDSPYSLTHSSFSNEIFIVCPDCKGKAIVKGPGLFQDDTDISTYQVCEHCGRNKKYEKSLLKVKILNGGVDPFFHQQLWYLSDCLKGIIWAYNLKHLELIEDFIRSTNRSRNGLPNKNNSIASRLPKWMSAAKNRKEVLNCIKRLKEKKVTSGPNDEVSCCRSFPI